MGSAIVGRDRERAELLAALQDAIGGRGGIFLISGEPGIGKTALAEHLAGLAAERGVGVSWSRGWSGDEATPYWAWSQIIRSLTADLDHETGGELLGSERPLLSRLVPELGDSLDESAEPIGQINSDTERFYLFDAVGRFLRRAASRRPRLVILDDLLAGGRSSLLLLRFLADEVRTSNLLLVATFRDAEARESPEVAEVFAELLRDAYLLALGELELSEVARLVASIAGVAPWAGKVRAIHEAAGGNPLFVREITRLLAGRDRLDRPGRLSIPVPDSVRAVIRRRIAPLSAVAVQVLSAAVVVGREFSLTLLDLATDLGVESVLSAVGEAVALGIVAEAEDTPGVYRFSHPLMRESIYEGLPLPTRTQMHQRVGVAIERLHAADPRSHLGALAYHFSRSAALGDSGKAGRYARQAGDRAMDSYAYEEAIVQYRSALDTLAISGRADPPLRCELLLRLGWAQARAGEYGGAKATLLLASEIARELGNVEHLASAALGIGEQLIEGGLVDRQLVDLLEEAIEQLGLQDSALRVRLLVRLSLELTFADGGAREASSLEALQIARRLGDARALSEALRARWMARWGPDGLDERTTLAEELLSAARASGDREKELIGLAQRITCSLQAGGGASIESDVAAHTRLAGELRMPYHEWASATIRAGQALLTGSLQSAETLAQQALDRLPGRSNAILAHLNQLSLLRWEQGRLGELLEEWERFVGRVPQLVFARAWLCLAANERGRTTAATDHLRDLVERLTQSPRDGLWPLAGSLTALAAADLNDRDAAASLHSLLLPYANNAVVLPMLHPVICMGSVSLYLGLLAATTEAWDRAAEHFEVAVGANQRINAGPFTARAYFEHARMLHRRGLRADRTRVRRCLDRAAAAAAEQGLPALSARIASLRASVAGWAGASRPEQKATSIPPDPGDTHSVRDGDTEYPDAESRAAAAPVVDSYGFRREGDYWTIDYEGKVVRLPDSKGLRCLARMLTRPGHQFLALDLEHTDSRRARADGATSARATTEGDLRLRRDPGDAGELLDPAAKAAYRARLDELREELEEAENFNDPVRAARAKEEQDFIARELARAVGLGGRDRRAASHAERARLNVTRAIRTAMKNLERVHPSLGDHLTLTIRTGRYCSYAPDPRVPVRWEN